jgi:hypothetical protein
MSMDMSAQPHERRGSTALVDAPATPAAHLRGWDCIELWVGNARTAAGFLMSAFGFHCTAYCGPETGVRDKASYVLEQGEIRFVVSGALDAASPIAEHVRVTFDRAYRAAAVRTIKLRDVPAICIREVHEMHARGRAPECALARIVSQIVGPVRDVGELVVVRRREQPAHLDLRFRRQFALGERGDDAMPGRTPSLREGGQRKQQEKCGAERGTAFTAHRKRPAS